MNSRNHYQNRHPDPYRILVGTLNPWNCRPGVVPWPILFQRVAKKCPVNHHYSWVWWQGERCSSTEAGSEVWGVSSLFLVQWCPHLIVRGWCLVQGACFPTNGSISTFGLILCVPNFWWNAASVLNFTEIENNHRQFMNHLNKIYDPREMLFWRQQSLARNAPVAWKKSEENGTPLPGMPRVLRGSVLEFTKFKEIGGSPKSDESWAMKAVILPKSKSYVPLNS